MFHRNNAELSGIRQPRISRACCPTSIPDSSEPEDRSVTYCLYGLYSGTRNSRIFELFREHRILEVFGKESIRFRAESLVSNEQPQRFSNNRSWNGHRRPAGILLLDPREIPVGRITVVRVYSDGDTSFLRPRCDLVLGAFPLSANPASRTALGNNCS